jgi:hypothetical protein
MSFHFSKFENAALAQNKRKTAATAVALPTPVTI